MNRSNDRNTNQLNFDIEYRTQYTFLTNDQSFDWILKEIANESVNIVGILFTKSRDSHNFVRLVPGTTESERKRDLKVVRDALDSKNIKYKEETIIAITNIPAGIPGVFSKIYSSLWCEVEVKSLYLGEKDFIFLTVSNLKLATEILTEENIRQC